MNERQAGRDGGPLVSVVLPVYNAERYLRQAVLSALDLSVRTEVLLVEDGSPDGCLAVCRQLAAQHEAVRLLRHADHANHGCSASRNAAIRAARGDYVAFLDADDYYLPNRFDADVPMLEADPGLDGVYGAVGVVYEPGGPPASSPERHRVTVDGVILPEDLFEAFVRGDRGWFRVEGITVRREVFDAVGLFDERLPIAQDRAMWLRMAAACRLAGGSIVEPIAVCRRHPGNRARLEHPLWRDAECEVYSTTLEWAGCVGLEAWKRHRLREALILALRHRRLRGLGRAEAFLRVWRRTLRCQARDPLLLPTIAARWLAARLGVRRWRT